MRRILEEHVLSVRRGAGLCRRVGRIVLVSCEAFDNVPPGLTGRMVVLSGRLPAPLFGLFMQQMRLKPLRASGERGFRHSIRHSGSLQAHATMVSGHSQHAKGPLAGPFTDGETRTRTGDTTIFRQTFRTLERR